MQRFLGRALSNLKADFNKNKKLRDESYILRMARAADEELPAEDVGRGLSKLVKDKNVQKEKPGTWLRAAKLYKEIVEGADQKNAETDLANVDFDDLRAALAETAMSLMLEDKDFFLSVAAQVFQEDPSLFWQIEESRPKPIDVKVKDG